MITVKKEQFLEAIKIVKSSVGKGSLQPVLETIHIKSENGGLVLTTTDLETSSRAICEANISEPFEVCLNANNLENIVNMLKDFITLDIKEGTVEIKSGKTHYNVIFIQPTEFPIVNFILDGNSVTISKEDFVKGTNKTAISTVNESSNNLLSGICFTFSKDGYEVAATDGNRLSQVYFQTPLNIEGQFVIPKKVLVDVAKNVKNEVEIYFNETFVTFKTGNSLFKQNLLNGTFPKYQQLIPIEFQHTAKIDKSALLSALEKVAIMSDERTNITIFDFTNNSLHLTTSCQYGKAEDTIEIDFPSEIKIAFNYRFILEGIKAMQSENVEFGINSPSSGCLVKGDFNYLVMPVQIR